jgi:hypothetical protein
MDVTKSYGALFWQKSRFALAETPADQAGLGQLSSAVFV